MTEYNDDPNKLSDALKSISRAILPNAIVGHDATDGHVSSLTEAIMGITAGLVRIAEAITEHGETTRLNSETTDCLFDKIANAIENHADAIRDLGIKT